MQTIAIPLWPLHRQLATMLILAFLVRLAGYALFSGIVHPDEIFQYSEQAHRLVFGQGIVPWEYRERIRSWLFPGFLAAIMQTARLIGDGPDVQNAAVAAVLALLSLPTVACCMLWGRQAAGEAGGLAAGVLAACWSEMVLMSIHPLLDSVGTDVLVPGVFLLQRATSAGNTRSLWVAGAMLGLALDLRIQLAPAIGWAMLRLCGKHPVRNGLPVAAGMALPVVLSGALDWVTLGVPFRSVYHYVDVNLSGVADHYGTEPWYTYLLLLALGAGVLFPVIAVCACAGLRRLNLLAELAAIILITGSILHHKEARFLFPMFPFLLTLAGAGSARLARRFFAQNTSLATGLAGVWIVLCAVNAPIAGSAALWARGQGMLREMHRVADDPQACGLALFPPEIWDLTGGYTHLQPGIVLVAGRSPVPTGRLTGFDYALAFEDIDLSAHGLTRLACRPTHLPERPGLKICLWHNQGHCEGPASPSDHGAQPLGGEVAQKKSLVAYSANLTEALVEESSFLKERPKELLLFFDPIQ